VLGNAVNLPGTAHTYSPTSSGTGTRYGPNGHDESFSTYFGTSGDGSHTVSAIHDFASPRDIAQIKYRLYSQGYAYGDDQADVTVEYQLLYTTNGSDWITITEVTS
jgi:hypothetical protein